MQVFGQMDAILRNLTGLEAVNSGYVNIGYIERCFFEVVFHDVTAMPRC